MAVDDWVTRVVGVLTRAEALFTAIQGPGPAIGDLGAAAGANEALAARSAELSGSGVSSHRDAVYTSAAAIGAAAETDAVLTEQLTNAASTHGHGAGQAGDLRGAATAIADVLGPLRGTAAGDIVVLKALRTQLADMQELVAAQSNHGSATAGAIRGLGYSS